MSEKKQLVLRLDKNIYDKVYKLAKQEKRSVNSQVEYMLDNSNVTISSADIITAIYNDEKANRR